MGTAAAATQKLSQKNHWAYKNQKHTIVIKIHSHSKFNLKKDGHQEKDTRSTLKSSIERKISKDKILILDSMNYIKVPLNHI